MTATTKSIDFTHVVKGDGPSKGFTVTGRSRGLNGKAVTADVPLIVALHGGTYTSEYFDIPGYSLMERAEALGIPIIAINRPGYAGSTEVPTSDSIILANASALDAVIAELYAEYGKGTKGVFIIGHSIGGAVTTAIAANPTSYPLLGIAISGCCLEVSQADRDQFNQLPDIPFIDLPSPMKDFVMFGPAGTFDADMPNASHASDTSVPRAELIDINNGWVEKVKSVNSKVTVPVHSRMGEFDHLWITDAKQVSDFGASFSASVRVNAQLVPSTGHCIDFHRPGAGFQLEQLGFALESTAPAPDAA